MSEQKRIEEIMTVGCESVESHVTITEAARKMKEQDIGALPICGEHGNLCGMVTDRDIVTEIIAAGLDPASTEIEN